MRNGSLPARIMHDLRCRGVAKVTTAELRKRFGSAATVSRALSRLVQDELLERIGRGLYRVLSLKTPKLAFDRAWSNPGATLEPDRQIAITLARPTIDDVIRLCRSFGVQRVRRVLGEMAVDGEVSSSLATQWMQRLENIVRGFHDAAARLPAGRNPATA